MEHFIDSSIKNNDKILIIDNLSFLNNENKELEIINKGNDLKKNNVYIISNSINKKFNNLIINPDKICEVNDFFKKNKISFDVIIDLNSSDYITQIACFSIFYSKINKKYLIKMENKHREIIIYNFQKFTTNVIVENNYLIITK